MPQGMDDHDLLVRLDTKLDALTAAFQELKTTVNSKADSSRVARLEERADNQDKRLDGHDKKLAMFAGGWLVFEALAKILWK
jgi:hypothetical protein